MSGQLDEQFVELLEAMKKTGGVLNEAEIPWVLGGGLACWARGGPETEHDVDILVKPEDAERAQQALAGAGMRIETPPEGWLLKAYAGDILIDLIFDPQGGPVGDAIFERAEDMEVYAMRMRVAPLEDVITEKLLALSEQNLDFAALLEELRVLGPVVLHDVLAVRVEEVRDERVERPLLSGAVAVHDDDLLGAGRLRAAHGRVDLLRVEPAALA